MTMNHVEGSDPSDVTSMKMSDAPAMNQLAAAAPGSHEGSSWSRAAQRHATHPVARYGATPMAQAFGRSETMNTKNQREIQTRPTHPRKRDVAGDAT
jgi:hypothetical protein